MVEGRGIAGEGVAFGDGRGGRRVVLGGRSGGLWRGGGTDFGGASMGP